MTLRPLSILVLGALAAGCAQEPLNADVPSSVEVLQAPADVPFGPWLQGQRDQVAQLRTTAMQRYHDEELACWHRFAVNACLGDARQQRRATLDALRQKDLALNAAEREQRTAERTRELEQKRQGSN